MAVTEPVDRFRSFAERYVIERAGKFEVGNELQGAWRATQDAKRIYDMIADASTAQAARRGEAAGRALAQDLIFGVPTSQVIRDMRAARIPVAMIHEYITDVKSGRYVASIPTPTAYINLFRRGQINGTPQTKRKPAPQAI